MLAATYSECGRVAEQYMLPGGSRGFRQLRQCPAGLRGDRPNDIDVCQGPAIERHHAFRTTGHTPNRAAMLLRDRTARIAHHHHVDLGKFRQVREQRVAHHLTFPPQGFRQWFAEQAAACDKFEHQ
ncbi:MAG: hypothetical protein M3Q00_07290 [Pseudomonadota bacterium]|nr:hypothetical protein [Pseudomonadota bacterium]